MTELSAPKAHTTGQFLLGLGLTVMSAFGPTLGIDIPYWVKVLCFFTGVGLTLWAISGYCISQLRRADEMLLIAGMCFGLFLFFACAIAYYLNRTANNPISVSLNHPAHTIDQKPSAPRAQQRGIVINNSSDGLILNNTFSGFDTAIEINNSQRIRTEGNQISSSPQAEPLEVKNQRQEISALSNSDLRSRVVSLSAKLRKMGLENRTAFGTIKIPKSSNQDEAKILAKKYFEQTVQLSNEQRHRFAQALGLETVIVAGELMKRTGKSFPLSRANIDNVLAEGLLQSGLITNSRTLEATANVLESFASELPTDR
jgi:hypothetical protein